MKLECTRGFGRVVNPITGDEIDVSEPFEVDEETATAIMERYRGFQVVEDTGTTVNVTVDGDEDTVESVEAEVETDDVVSEVDDLHWRTAQSDIEDGEYDDSLDDLAEAFDDESAVGKAVRERQAKL